MAESEIRTFPLLSLFSLCCIITLIPH